MHLDYNTNTNTTWTRDESIALWNLAQARPTLADCLESDDPEGDARRISRYTRHVDDTAYALGLSNDPTRLAAFRSAAWYGEVVR